VITGVTGFIAALSGLVAGLNQLGVFKRDSTAAAPPNVVAPAPARTTADSTPAAAPQAKAPTPTAPSSAKPAQPARPATPKPVPAPAPAPPAADVQLAAGAHIDLTVPARACASGSGKQRVFALVATPVEAEGATLVPAGAPAVLRLRRAESGNHPNLTLDSLSGAEVSSANVRIRRGADGKACLRPDARLIATLGAPVTLPSR
jgi:hypothetical protein